MTIVAEAFKLVGIEPSEPLETNEEVSIVQIDPPPSHCYRSIRIYLADRHDWLEVKQFKSKIANFLTQHGITINTTKEKEIGPEDVLSVSYREAKRDNGCESWIKILCRSSIVGQKILDLLKPRRGWGEEMSIIQIALVEHIDDYYHKKLKPSLSEAETIKPTVRDIRLINLALRWHPRNNINTIDYLKTELNHHDYYGQTDSAVYNISTAVVGQKSSRQFIIKIACRDNGVSTILDFLNQLDWPDNFRPLEIIEPQP